MRCFINCFVNFLFLRGFAGPPGWNGTMPMQVVQQPGALVVVPVSPGDGAGGIPTGGLLDLAALGHGGGCLGGLGACCSAAFPSSPLHEAEPGLEKPPL